MTMLKCDKCGLNFPAKRITVESDDTVGQCLNCRPLFLLAELISKPQTTIREQVIRKLEQFLRREQAQDRKLDMVQPRGPLVKYLRS